MTIKKLPLTLSIILSCGLVIGGMVYAQEGAAPRAPKDDIEVQEPEVLGDQNFAFFFAGGTFLGVHVEDVSKENMGSYGMREVRGVGVTDVVKDSPAEKAGLRKGDVILRFEGESVTSVRKLNRLVSESSDDQAVRLMINRGGSEQEVAATLATRKGMENVMGSQIRDQVLRGIEGGFPKDKDGKFVFTLGSYRRIGVSTQQLTRQLAEYFGVSEGALITSVSDNSPASKAGLKAGDVITGIDGEKVGSPGDITRALSKKEDGAVNLTIVRNRQTQSITVTPEKPAPRRGIGAGTGTAETRTIVTPRIEIPVIPAINIQTPQIVIPAIPSIDITVPSTRRVIKPRVVII